MQSAAFSYALNDHDFNTEEAYAFYRAYILDQDKQRLQREYGFKVMGRVSSKEWGLFAAILVGDRSTEGYSTDLEGHKVKSVIWGNNF